MCNKISNKAQRGQSGATLIVSLVILTVVTILGLASMRNSNLELKMASSARDRGVAFQNAESALRVVEDMLTAPAAGGNATLSFSLFDLAGRGGCGTSCFNKNCDNGLCFSGDFDGEPQFCSLAAPDTGEVTQKWKDIDWDATSNPKYNTVQVPNSDSTVSVNNNVKYIIEFMCFVPKNSETKFGGPPPKMLPLFRVTTRASGEAGRSSVMLQSVFRASQIVAVSSNNPNNPEEF